jgi:hypothetical protein
MRAESNGQIVRHVVKMKFATHGWPESDCGVTVAPRWFV